MRVVLNDAEQLQSFLFFPAVPKVEDGEIEEEEEEPKPKRMQPPQGFGIVRISGRKKKKRVRDDEGESCSWKTKKERKRKKKMNHEIVDVKIEEEGDDEEEEENNTLALVKCEVEDSVESGRSRGSVVRWSNERYERAEQKLIEIVRAKGGVRGSPLLRKDLREEARKHIGDTGLLDHLLKHTAGKIVTGDEVFGERFMRRHNADGAMVYWLEPADAPLQIEGGEQMACGAECKEEINRLRTLVGTLNRDMEELRSLKELEKSVWQENYERLLKRNIKLEADMAGMTHSFQGLKDNYERLLKRNAKLEEKMAGMRSSFQGLKEEMQLLREDRQKDDEKNAAEVEIIEDAKGNCDKGGADKYGNEHFVERYISMLPKANGSNDDQSGVKKKSQQLDEHQLSMLQKAKGGSENGADDKMSEKQLHEHHLSVLPKDFCAPQLQLPYLQLPC